jgi:L-iditol 2-dehydrogenase
MKVAVYYSNKDIRIQERPKPKIGEGEILLKVKASGICGTDVMEWYRIKKAPRILGHETTGDIAEVGEGVRKFRAGQRVFVTHHVPCYECKYCLEGNHTACEVLHEGNYDPGGFSEFIRVPEINVEHGTFLLPENISYEEGTMIEPLACCLRGQKVINVKEGQTVLILGSGVSGLSNVQLAKLRGARVVATDVDDYKLRKAKEFGADEVIDARENFNLKAERIIVCTGALQAAQQAFKHIDRKGIILFFAIANKNIEIPAVDFWRNEITVTSSYGAAPDDLRESLELIKDKKINVHDLITHEFPLTEITKGFQLAANPKDSLKVVIHPNR